MDIFNEQLVKIKPTAKVITLKIVIWLLALIAAAFCFYLAAAFTPLCFLAGAGALFLGYKSSISLNIEYEYSVTNGTMDIDKIINKSNRKKLHTFECRQIEKVEKYLPKSLKGKKANIYTGDLDNALLFIVNISGQRLNIVISPNQKLIDNIKIFIPRATGLK